MLILLKLLAAATLLELVLWILPSVKARQVYASVLAIPLLVISFVMIVVHPSMPTFLLFLVSIYRAINLERVTVGRMNRSYLRRMAIRTSLWLIGAQALVLVLWSLGHWWNISTYHLWVILSYLELLGCGVLVSSTFRHLRTTRAPRIELAYADKDLPSITVAIPARNETEDLQECLDSLVGSNYPKLEIIVLDDCSQNKRTPEIIRQYAHDGVRFIQGTVPRDNWLAKNHAYQRLFEEANGELIIFCGVDTRFAKESLRFLVSAMLQKSKSMISIIPRNVISSSDFWQNIRILQPMRYAWELALPRKLFRRPPVLSTCWVIKRSTLENAGGFAAVSRSIVPESYFARVSAVHDGYSFMQSGTGLNVISNKSLLEQFYTAVRMRYPQTHRRIELVLILTIAELFGMFLPFLMIILALMGRLSLHLAIINIVVVVASIVAYSRIVSLTYQQWRATSLLTLPIAILVDTALLNYSMFKYEFSSVVWKQRNVCVPVMRIETNLPNLPESKHRTAINQ